MQGWQPPTMTARAGVASDYQLPAFDLMQPASHTPRPAAVSKPIAAADTPLSEDEILANELQALREQIQAEAYEAGLAEGHAEAKRILAEQTQQLQLAIAALRQPAKWLDASLQKELSELVSVLTKSLLRHELTVSPERVGELVREAVELLPVTQGPIEIVLHPEDAKVLTEMGAEGEEGLDPHWQLSEDPTMARGGCRIRSGSSRIDQSIEQRLDALLLNAEPDSHG